MVEDDGRGGHPCCRARPGQAPEVVHAGADDASLAEPSTISGVDPVTLLGGFIGELAGWWVGRLDLVQPAEEEQHRGTVHEPGRVQAV